MKLISDPSEERLSNRGVLVADGDERVELETRAQWRDWLAGHHARSRGVWLVTWKRASGRPVLEYEDAVREALCFGWVDGQLKPVDGDRTSLRFSPRRPGSPWARSNKDRVAGLAAAGLMTAAGQAVVDAARADGSWSMLDEVENLMVPDDLATALAAAAPADTNFAGFTPAARRAALQWILLAKRPLTRAKRIEAVALAARKNQRVAP